MKIKIALPKGRYLKYSKEIIRAFNFDIYPNKLNYILDDLEIYLVKSSDIPRLLNQKHFDLGICPDEWWMEETLSHSDKLDSLFYFVEKNIEWSNINLVLFGKEGTSVADGELIATSYPNILKYFFITNGLKEMDSLYVAGSVEAFVPNVTKYGFDCVETGNTLEVHSLKSINTFYKDLKLSMCILKSNKSLLENEYLCKLVGLLKTKEN